MKAEEFNLPDENGKLHKLSDYKGKWVVLYFYPKDDTPGCTKEACGFRDGLNQLEKIGVVVLGVSKDSPRSHLKFKEKYHLNFSLLSDESKEMMQAYGAWGEKSFMEQKFMGTLRKTYLIDPNGEVRKVYEKVDPTKHSEEILADVKNFLNITQSRG